MFILMKRRLRLHANKRGPDSRLLGPDAPRRRDHWWQRCGLETKASSINSFHPTSWTSSMNGPEVHNTFGTIPNGHRRIDRRRQNSPTRDARAPTPDPSARPLHCVYCDDGRRRIWHLAFNMLFTRRTVDPSDDGGER
jgi:hypothetical protein